VVDDVFEDQRTCALHNSSLSVWSGFFYFLVIKATNGEMRYEE
jgi:hypothetical protein